MPVSQALKTKLMQALAFCAFVLIVVVGNFSCTPSSPTSEVDTTREGREMLGSAQGIDPTILSSVSPRLDYDWQDQQALAWRLWADLLGETAHRDYSFSKWQSWYSKEDLQRVFRNLFEGLGKDGRQSRRSFLLPEIEAALYRHDHDQKTLPGWNQARFDSWLGKFDTDLKKASVPGMNKILMNREALLFFLQNYQAIFACHRQGECRALQMPEQAILLKTSWRRAQDGFELPAFAMDSDEARKTQFEANEWQSTGSWIPADGHSYHMMTATGQDYHLVGLHASVKLKSSWFYTSIWLDQKPTEASPLPGPWSYYRMCTSGGFDPLEFGKASGELGGIAEAGQNAGGSSWCSNPYLEPGVNNQKTNCIGCHQHAGSPWNEGNFVEKLTNDLTSLTANAGVASKSDLVWSVFNGPDPYANLISDEIENFDLNDSF